MQSSNVINYCLNRMHHQHFLLRGQMKGPDLFHISYSYYVLTEYIYPYDVLLRHYVEFVYGNDVLMRKSAEFIYARLAKKENPHKSSQFIANILSRSRDFFPN